MDSSDKTRKANRQTFLDAITHRYSNVILWLGFHEMPVKKKRVRDGGLSWRSSDTFTSVTELESVCSSAVFLWHHKETQCFVHRSQRPWSRRNRRGSSGCPTRWSSSSRPCPLRAESKASAAKRRERRTDTDSPRRWPQAGATKWTWDLWASTAKFLPPRLHFAASRPKQRLCLQSRSCHMEETSAEKETTWLVFIYFCSFLKDIFFWQEIVFCVCMSVRLRRAEELCRTVRANGEIDLLSILWENSSEAEIENYLTLRKRTSCGTAVSTVQFHKLYFCTCTFEDYQLQVKYPLTIL